MPKLAAPAACLLLLILTACQATAFLPPTAHALEAAPFPITTAQLVAAYQNDPAAAMQAYQGKRLAFSAVPVETLKPMTRNDPQAYFTAGGIFFKPRYGPDLDSLAEGSLVDVVGRVESYSFGVMVVGDCWVKVVGGVTTRAGSGY